MNITIQYITIQYKTYIIIEITSRVLFDCPIFFSNRVWDQISLVVRRKRPRAYALALTCDLSNNTLKYIYFSIYVSILFSLYYYFFLYIFFLSLFLIIIIIIIFNYYYYYYYFIIIIYYYYFCFNYIYSPRNIFIKFSIEESRNRDT